MSQIRGPLLPLESTTAKDQPSISEIEIHIPNDKVSEKNTLQTHNRPTSQIDLKATHLISAPYTDLPNQLLLSNLSIETRLFAQALTILQPTRPDYATAPYLDSFNWTEVFALLRTLTTQSNYHWTSEKAFYVVIFRSKLQAGIDRERLGLLDRNSHEEACASGGLLKYWFGETDGERRNLATCLWRSHEDAVAGGGGPWHKQARAAARVMYESISFHTHKLIVGEGATTWRLEDFRP